MSFTLALIGRISTPKSIQVAASGKKEARVVYMNLNLSWELWKDVKNKTLAELYDKVPRLLVIFGISFFWNLGSLVGLGLFRALEQLAQ